MEVIKKYRIISIDYIKKWNRCFIEIETPRWLIQRERELTLESDGEKYNLIYSGLFPSREKKILKVSFEVPQSEEFIQKVRENISDFYVRDYHNFVSDKKKILYPRFYSVKNIFFYNQTTELYTEVERKFWIENNWTNSNYLKCVAFYLRSETGKMYKMKIQGKCIFHAPMRYIEPQLKAVLDEEMNMDDKEYFMKNPEEIKIMVKLKVSN